MSLASVAIPLPIYKDFTYRIPPEFSHKIKPGSVVEVEFHGSRRVGCVFSIQTVDADLKYELKDILSFLPVEPLADWQMRLARQIALRTFSSRGESIGLFLPEYHSSWKKWLGRRVIIHHDVNGFIETLMSHGVIDPSQGIQLFIFKELCRLTSKKLDGLAKKNHILLVDEENSDAEHHLPFLLKGRKNWWQRGSLSESVPLLQELVTDAFHRGLKTIVLFPGPKVLDFFHERLQSAHPSIRFLSYDGRLSSRERMLRYQMVGEGYYDVLVGTRLALFLPIHDVAIHILFDPDEYGHSSDQYPRYHSFYTLLDKVDLTGGELHIVGTVPDLALYLGLQNGYFQARIAPTAKDSRNHSIKQVTYEQKKSTLTRLAQKTIAENLSSRKNTIIWVQKTGYSAALGCSDCGYYYCCSDCDVALRYYQREKYLQCPRCGKKVIPEDFCPQCRGTWMKTWGEGVEKIFQFLKRSFPGVPVVKAVSDQNNQNFAEDVPEPMIMVGTSAVLREEVLSRASLFIIHSFEDWLFIPDFLLREKLYQDIHRAIHFLGGENPIKTQVLIETSKQYQKYTDQFFLPITEFYKIELDKRKKYNYPPWRCFLQVVARSRNKEDRYLVLNSVKNQFNHEQILIDGPFPSVSTLKKSAWSDQLVIKFDLQYLGMVYDKIIGMVGSRKMNGVEIDFRVLNTLAP